MGLRCVALFSLIGGVTCSNALAQDAALGEIVVTATKRGDVRLQTLPASISALDGATLERMGVEEFTDFARSIAGLDVVDLGPGDKRYFIRGLNLVGEATTALYYDNVTVSGSGEATANFGDRQPDLALFDIERVEVLRGPQGTLYGANSQGGVIRVITRKPVFSEYEAKVQLDLSDTTDGGFGYSVKAMGNAPLLSDNVAVRALVLHQDRSGFIDNVLRGEDDVNDVETTGGRVTIGWDVSESTHFLGQFFYQDLESGAQPDHRPVDQTILFQSYPAAGERNTSEFIGETFRDESMVFAATLEHERDWADFSVAASLFERDVDADLDVSVSQRFFGDLQSIGEFPAPPDASLAAPDFGILEQPQEVELLTIEARANTKFKGRVNALAGIWYSDRTIDFFNRAFATDANGNQLADVPIITSRTFETTTEDLSLFTEVTFDLTDKLSVLGGVRYFFIDQTNASETIVGFFGIVPTGTSLEEADFEDSITKAQVSYEFTEDLMAYFTRAEGFRYGGTNATPIPEIPIAFDPDTSESLEIGFKSSFFDDRLIVNGALYRMEISDLQVKQSFLDGAFEGTVNASGEVAKVEGAELEISMLPLAGLEIVFSGNLIDSEITQDLPDVGAVKGDPLLHVPDNTFSIAGEYRFPLAGQDAFARVDYQHVGDVDKTRYDDNDVALDSYELVNLRFGIEYKNYDLQLYVRNVFDEVAELNVENNVQEPLEFLTNQPRTIGATLSYSF